MTGSAKASGTVVSADGKTYIKREAGSPFASNARMHQRSCFYCGTHRVMDEMLIKRFMGRSESVCKDAEDCKSKRRKT